MCVCVCVYVCVCAQCALCVCVCRLILTLAGTLFTPTKPCVLYLHRMFSMTSQSILCVQMYCNGHTQYTVYNKAVHYYFRKVRPYNRKMTSKVLKLFCDMKSHPARAALLLLKTTGIPHEEVRLDLFR